MTSIKKKDKIAVIGLGYVGLPLARLFATQYNVVGFYNNKTRIQELTEGVDKTLEIEFKHHINTAQHINIPLKVIKDYVEALKYDDILSEDSESFESYLKVVHSNFRN